MSLTMTLISLQSTIYLIKLRR